MAVYVLLQLEQFKLEVTLTVNAKQPKMNSENRYCVLKPDGVQENRRKCRGLEMHWVVK